MGESHDNRADSVRKLVLPALLLVGSAFLIHGALNVWYTWRQTEALMIDVQRQKADALAAQIEQFVVATQSQISWSTAGVPAEQQRVEWLRLLRNAPAITELTHVGADGKESLFVSRLAMDKVGRGTDFANDVRFTEAMKRQTYVGPVHFPKPAEPYVSIAVARGGTGVTLAEVSVKKVWDMVAAIKVGETGYAYIVDGKGRLIADRDPALVVESARRVEPAAGACCAGSPRDRGQREGRTFDTSPSGASVLSANAAVPVARVAGVRRAAGCRGVGSALERGPQRHTPAGTRPCGGPSRGCGSGPSRDSASTRANLRNTIEPMNGSRPRERLLRGEQFRELNVAEGSNSAVLGADRSGSKRSLDSSSQRADFRVRR